LNDEEDEEKDGDEDEDADVGETYAIDDVEKGARGTTCRRGAG
jgi:hypothetical protein